MKAVLEWLATFSAAFFTAWALYVSLIEPPARMEAAAAAALAHFRPSYRRAAPWQASLAGLCLLSGLFVSLLTSQWSWLVGGLCVGAAIPFTLLVIMPINRRLLATNPPLDTEEVVILLSRWGRLHWVRTILGVSGLTILLFSAKR